MKDRLLRISDKEVNLRIFAVQSTELVEKARKIHNTSPTASAALGRSLSASLLMGLMLKNEDDKLTFQIKGGGPLGGIVVVSNYRGKVKGYVNNPEVYIEPNALGKLDVGGAIGKEGYINIIKDIGMKEPYVGYVPLVSGEIGEDLAHYFVKSEQVPSIVALGVLVDKTGEILSAGGVIIQLMPFAGEEFIEEIEKNLKKFSSITLYLSEGESLEAIVKRIVGDIEINVMEEIEPEFNCDCSYERMMRALAALGRQELEELIKTQGTIETECHFCLNKYQFGKEDMKEILES